MLEFETWSIKCYVCDLVRSAATPTTSALVVSSATGTTATTPKTSALVVSSATGTATATTASPTGPASRWQRTQFPKISPVAWGRWTHAKKLLQSNGEHTPLPNVFHEGGRRPAVGGKGKGKTGKVMDWRYERVHSVMGLVVLHEGEHRRWNSDWGALEGGSEE